MVNPTTKDPVWVTQGYGFLRISKMTRTHIMHCLRLMDKNPHWRTYYRARLELELRVRGAIGRTD